ncbi:hypothetical protein ACYFX5_17110 [Bremerella sp. T1]|uniref:hypothetical protein n=1 Tax=Bremerella sp. TYQ1 TaxID=3119568 RepID=UPI001CCA8AB7|nr:hypothetical protein [Bremerella volcania]UBM34778.1 hypothetical protein LA756_19060 [Bremerella volcania]
MNRLFFILAAVCLLAGSGCCHHQIGASPCNNPTSVSAPPPAVQGGAGSAQVTYPYYTTRGPRDFLDPAPFDIGY